MHWHAQSIDYNYHNGFYTGKQNKWNLWVYIINTCSVGRNAQLKSTYMYQRYTHSIIYNYIIVLQK